MSERDVEPPSVLERLLHLVTVVRPGEAPAALQLLAGLFLLLAANYCLKPARDGLLAVVSAPGLSDLELKAYASFGQSLLLLAIVPVYARLASRFRRSELVTVVTLFCIANLGIFWLLQPGLFVGEIRFLGIVFYLWVGIFNVFVVAQFWAFVADLYSTDRGQRLFPLIGLGAAAGATMGSWLVKVLLAGGVVGTYGLLLLSACLLGASLAFMRSADERGPVAGSNRARDEPLGTDTVASFGGVLRSRYLLAIAGIVLFLNWVKTNGDNLLFAIVQEVLAEEVAGRDLAGSGAEAFVRDQTTAFYGDFLFWVSVGSLILQGLLASRLVRRWGVIPLVGILPAITAVSYGALAVVPALAIFRLTKIAEDSTNYSLHNTGIHLLWLPTPRSQKYRAKAAVDTFFVRTGDGLAAATAFVGTHWLFLGVSSFFALNWILSILWIGCAGFAAIENRRRLRDGVETSTDPLG